MTVPLSYGYNARSRPPRSPMRPNDRAGILGPGSSFTRPAAPKPAKPAAPRSGYTAAQVQASLDANPLASHGGYGVDANGNAVGQAMGAAPPSLDPYDYSVDPILNKIKALSRTQRVNAQSEADAIRKQLGIAYGSAEAVGFANDPLTLQAANDNPFSLNAELKRSYDRGLEQLDQTLNSQGLFYSGERARQLGLAAEDYLRQQAAAKGNLQQHLADVQSSLTAALLGADQQDITAETDAAGRAQGRSLEFGVDPGAASGTVPIVPMQTTPAVPAPAGEAGDPQGGRAAIPTDSANPLAYILGRAHRRRNPRDLLFEVGG